METIYVIAGNFREFKYFAKDYTRYRYVSNIIELYGVYQPSVICTGTYYRRTDWNKIKIILKIANASISYKENKND